MTLSSTRFFLPEPAFDVIQRQLLSAQPCEAFHYKLTLICAPAGFGKTTLMAGWLRTLAAAAADLPLHVAWYALDAGDNSLYHFYRYLVAVIRQADPGVLPDWPDLDYRPQPPTVQEMAWEIVEGISARPNRIVLALDDYHVITQREIHSLMSTLLRFQPANLHLVIGTRSDPPIGLLQLRMRSQVYEVRASDLAFSQAETAAFLSGRLNTQLTPETVTALWQRTEGWAAGLRLAALSLQDADDPQQLVQSFSQVMSRDLTDYLVDEVLQRQPPAVSQLLLHISILDRFCAGLCAAVTGAPLSESQEMVDHLMQHSLFVTALDDQGEWHRLHSLFQLMLRSRLEAQLAPAELTGLHRRAAAWFAAHDLTQEAVTHYLAAGDEEGAAEATEARVFQWLNAEQFLQLEHGLARLPGALIEDRPVLLLASAWVAFSRYERNLVPAMVARVEQLLQTEPWDEAASSALWGQVHALRAIVNLVRHEPTAVIASAQEALRLLPAEHIWARSHLLGTLALLHMMAGQVEEGHRLLAMEMALLGARPTFFRLRLNLMDGGLYVHSGTLEEQQRVAAVHLALVGSDSYPVQTAWAEWVSGAVQLERGEIEAGTRQLEAVFARQQLVVFQTLLLAASDLLPIYARQGRLAEGAGVLAILAQRLHGKVQSSSAAEVEALQACWAAVTGDCAAAAQWASSAELVLPPAEFMSKYNLLLIRLLLALGRPADLERAAGMTTALAAFYRSKHMVRRLIETLVLRAQVCWAQAQREPAVDALGEALDLGYPRGYRRIFLEPEQQSRSMLSALSRRSRHAAAAAALLALLPAGSNAGSNASSGLDDQSVGRAAEVVLSLSPAGVVAAQPRGQSRRGPAAMKLSLREQEILTLLAQGLTNSEIACATWTSPRTVRNHLTRIFDKLDVATRQAAVKRAQEANLL